MDVNAGRGFVFVSHVGTVHPSGFLPVPAGDVRTTPLPEIYRESALFTGAARPRPAGRALRPLRVRAGVRRVAVPGVRRRPATRFAEEPWCGYEPGSFPFAEDIAELLAGRAR